jgi:hypothetical protein
MHTLKVMITTFALLSGVTIAGSAQEIGRGFHEHARGLIDRTQDDLRRAEDFERRNGKEISRYETADKHLSDFDRALTKDHFDKGKLDNAVGDLKDVVEHNTLDPESRDALRWDLGDLRILRAERN